MPAGLMELGYRLKARLTTLMRYVTGAQPLELVVPAYFYPTPNSPYWGQLNLAARRVALTAIVNPASGPGTESDINYVAAINQLRQAGGKVLAYVHTRYGQRPLAQVKADIAAYQAWYPLDGIFLDEMSNDGEMAKVLYYQSIYTHIKALDSRWSVMGNPGNNTQEIYLSFPTVDSLVVFENGHQQLEPYAPSSWQKTYPNSCFVIMVYGATGAQMQRIVQRATELGVGAVFVTDDVMPNPYDVLPSYWDDEVKAVSRQ